MSTIAQELLMRRLRPADMGSSSRPQCLPGTQIEILDTIITWLLTPAAGPENILWLHGLAGSGKSTISTTIAERCFALRRRGAFLHFDRNDKINSHPNAVIRTLVHQLAQYHPLIRETICNQLEADAGVEDTSFSTQFETLLRRPLDDFATLHSEGPIAVIIDSLDECSDAQSRMELLEVLRTGLAKLPPVFRILITSRHEPDLHAFLTLPNVKAQSLGLAVDRDIGLYLRSSFDRIPRDEELAHDWPRSGDLQKLGHLAGGLFIWASTAIKFISTGNYPDDQLKLLLDPTKRELKGLDGLYKLVLSSAVNWESKKDAQFYRAVLGAIIVSRIPITDVLLDGLLHPLPHKVRSFLNRLRCLFDWTSGQVIRILHTSFTDYLCDLEQCGDAPWLVEIAVHHHSLALGCFGVMARELRFNICEIPTSFYTHMETVDLSERREQNISPVLVYAACYWVDHVEPAFEGFDEEEGGNAETLLEAINDFIRERFFYWLEVMSFQDAIVLASSMLLKTAECIKVSVLEEPSVCDNCLLTRPK